MSAKQRTGVVLTSVICLLTSACSGDGWFGSDESDKPLPGKRISVLEHRENLSSDKEMAGVKVTLPGEQSNGNWTHQQSQPVQHPAWSGAGNTDTASAVAGGSSSVRLTSAPVVAEGLVYVLGGDGTISARRANNIGEEVWEHTIKSGEEQTDLMGLGVLTGTGEREFIGGNIAYGDGLLFAATRRGDVLALDGSSGALKWQRSVKLPVKSAPVIRDGRLFIITNDNRLYALSADTGETMWIHAGLAETTSIFGAPSPAVTDAYVIVPYSSGEINGLEVRTGQVLWSDVLASDTRRRPSSINLSGNSTPVVKGGIAYATSYDGVLAAFSLSSGNRQWTQDIGGLFSPWAAGDFLYILTSDNEVLCLQAQSGKVKWVAELPRHAEAGTASFSDKGERISWSGPVLAGGKLLVAGSHGQLLEITPQDGKISGGIEIPDGVTLPPVVANGTVYVLSNSGTLAAVK